MDSLLQTPLTIKILLLLGQFFLQIIFGYLQYKLGFYSEQGCVQKNLHLTNRPWPWFVVICAFIDNDIRHHSGQNVVGL